MATLLSRSSGVEYQPMICRPIDVGRNQAVKHFLKQKQFTHLFFLDDDTVPPLDCLHKLLALDEPLVSGIYPLPSAEGIFWSVAKRETDSQPSRGKYKYHLTRKLKSHITPFEADNQSKSPAGIYNSGSVCPEYIGYRPLLKSLFSVFLIVDRKGFV